MKIVHTADWHLGKIIHNVYMTEDQTVILDSFLEQMEQIKPDAIVIAGDLYDRAIPPKDAVELLNRVLTTLVYDMKIPVLAITGNHDSAERMNFGTQLLKNNGLYIQSKLDESMEPIILEDEFGSIYFHLIPYIEPAEARELFDDSSIDSHKRTMERVVYQIEEKYDLTTDRHVFVGHAFLAGGMESDSEERLTMIGGTSYIQAELFKPFTYTAFGHLHQPQKVVHDHIRYSGSLFKYSFSEVHHKKGFTVVEFDQDGVARIEQHPFQIQRDMKMIEGYLEELMNVEHVSDDYYHIKLLDHGEIIDPMGKLRKNYPNILRLERDFSGTEQLQELKRVKERRQMSHVDLFQSFYENMKGESLTEKRKSIVQNVIQKLMDKERSK